MRVERIGNCTLYLGDCREILPELSGANLHACVTDPPYHLTAMTKRFGKKDAAPPKPGKDGSFKRLSRGFMGQEWDGGDVAFRGETWEHVWKAVAPGAHLSAFAGTRTYHRMATAIEAAGFEIRDMLAWLYGSGFPKSLDIGKAIDKAAGATRDTVQTPFAANLMMGGPGNDGRWERSGSGISRTCRAASGNGCGQTMGRVGHGT